MTVKCQAFFDGNGAYFSGQTVTGRICLLLDERILIKYLALKISGYAQTEWDTAKKNSGSQRIVNGREDYISTTSYLIGSEESTSIMLPVGTYNYSFTCSIPETGPSSYESISGYIRYNVRAVVEYTTHRSEELLSESIHVIKPYDLRPLEHDLRIPLDLEMYEAKCCCEYWKTPICLYMNLPQGGYVPGEIISIYLRLLNDGKVPLRHLAISLNQVVTYTSRIPRECKKTERYNIVQIISALPGNIPLREFLERIPVPSLPPTCDTDCKVIQVTYEIEALVEQVKGTRGVVVRIPIIIGTISFESAIEPIHEKADINNEKKILDEAASVNSSAMVSTSRLDAGSSMSSTGIADINATAGSSFQEAAFMSAADLRKEDPHSLNKDKSGFKPKYLYYEINEDIDMTPTTMEITKEITITSK